MIKGVSTVQRNIQNSFKNEFCNGVSLALKFFSDSFEPPQMHWSWAFEQQVSMKFKCPAYACPPPTPSPRSLTVKLTCKLP